MLQAAAADLTQVIMESVRQMVEAEVKRHLDAATPVPPSRNEATVVLWSSELAAYMDTDPWQTRLAVLAKVWRRSHEGSYRSARESWLARGKRPLHVTSKHVMASNGEKAAASTPPTRVYTDPYVRIQTPADVSTFRAERPAKDVLKLYRTKGKLLEEETALLFSESIQQPVGLRNAAVIWQPVGSNSGLRTEPSVRALGPIVTPGPYVLQGEIDACLTQPPFANVPVEFKLRMTGIPSTIPLRDIAQLHSYMAMMGSSRGFLVQRAFGSDAVDASIVQWDEALWTGKIVPAMEAVVCDTRRLMRGAIIDEELRHTVLLAAETCAPPPPSPPSPTDPITMPPSSPVELALMPLTTLKLKKPKPKRKLPIITIPAPEMPTYNLRKRTKKHT